MQVASGSCRGNMEPGLPHSTQRGGEIVPNARASYTQDQQITALPIHSFRDSSSAAITSQTRAYGRVLSHNPHASTSSNISADPFSHRRRGSTLKVVMRKIFGKRRSHLEEDEDTEGPSAVSQRTVGTIRGSLVRGPNRMVFEAKPPSPASIGPASSKRKKSLVVSHPSSVSSEHVALTSQDKSIEIPSQIIRRRATLPSLILTEDDDTKKSIFSTLSPTSTRPASADNVVHEVDENNEDSKSQPDFRAHRRSRSADALQDLVRQHHRMSPIQWRRRSDEIKFWRTSVFENEEDDELDQPETSAPDVPSTMATDSQNPDINGGVDTPHSEPAAAPFPLESLLATMADPDATVEQRLTTIEVKLMDLEFAISKIQGTDNNVFTKPAVNSAEQRKVYEDSPSSVASDTSSQSSLSFGHGAGRPISTSTVRPSMVYTQPPSWQTSSWSSSMNLHGISIEQYSALVTLVRREQTARKALETQVTQLQEEMQQIRRASGLPASPPGTLYPIPSPDSEHARFRRPRPSSSRKDSNTSADTKYSESRTRDSPNKYRYTRDTDSRNGSNMI